MTLVGWPGAENSHLEKKMKTKKKWKFAGLHVSIVKVVSILFNVFCQPPQRTLHPSTYTHAERKNVQRGIVVNLPDGKIEIGKF